MAHGEGNHPELPQEIIHHILSFLTTKQASKTRFLSNAWRHAYCTSPTLDFDCEDMVAGNSDIEGRRKRKKKIYAEALQYIISVLLRYHSQKIGLYKFKLAVSELQDLRTLHPLLDQCMKLAVENGVRSLNLFRHFPDSSLDLYALPPEVFEAKSLVDLSLGKCCLQHQKMVMCCSLKRLQLDRVHLDELMFENIMSNCPLIEILELDSCRKIRKFKVADLQHNLKQLNVKLEPDQSIEIGATNLEFVNCALSWRVITPADYTAPLLLASQYKNLRSLWLLHVRFSDDFFINLEDKFPHLEDLSIEGCNDLQIIRISSFSLKEIHLRDNKGLEKALFDVPRLVLFEAHDIIPQLSFTSSSGLGRWVSCIKLSCFKNVDALWFLELRIFLASLNRCEIFLGLTFGGDVAFNMEEMSNTVAFPKCQAIQEVCIAWTLGLPLQRVRAILDGIFWICYPPKITLLPLDRQHMRFAKHLYETLLKLRSNPGCFNSKRSKFWKRDLKGFKDFEIFETAKFSKGGKGIYTKMGRGSPQSQAMDLGQFSEALRAPGFCRTGAVSFNLEWKTSDLPRLKN